MPEPLDAFYIDSNGCLTERRRFGGEEVIVHYDDIPDTDITTHRGIPVTTPLRTVIDLAPDMEPDHLRAVILDCLRRRLFTVPEARVRLAQPDMATRRGAEILRQALLG